MQLSLLLGVLGTSSSCAHGGPDVTGCVVDSASLGFQCANSKTKYYITFEQGKDLLCASPSDIEDFLKACKDKKVILITLCRFDTPLFTCTKSPGEQFQDVPEHMDNYFCLSQKDRKRVIERCK